MPLGYFGQTAEVGVVSRHDHAPLCNRPVEHRDVRRFREPRIKGVYDVKSTRDERRRNTSIHVLVEQQPHQLRPRPRQVGPLHLLAEPVVLVHPRIHLVLMLGRIRQRLLDHR